MPELPDTAHRELAMRVRLGRCPCVLALVGLACTAPRPSPTPAAAPTSASPPPAAASRDRPAGAEPGIDATRDTIGAARDAELLRRDHHIEVDPTRAYPPDDSAYLRQVGTRLRTAMTAAACGADDGACLCRAACTARLDSPRDGAVTLRYPFADVDGLVITIGTGGSVQRCAFSRKGASTPAITLECADAPRLAP